MYKVYWLNYILNESQVNTKNTNFVTSLLQCNQLFLERVKMKYFQTHRKLSKFIIRDMLFPTKITSLFNTRGLIDSASLENHHNNRPKNRSHQWTKTFLGRCIGRKARIWNQSYHYNDATSASWCLNLLVTRVFVQFNSKENPKALHYWPGYRWIPLTKDLSHGKRFHSMTSSWWHHMGAKVLLNHQ